MKGLSFLIMLLLLNRIALCQPSTLQPTIIREGTTDFRCFYPNQYNYIVTSISNEIYCDSIEPINIQTIHQLDSIVKKQTTQNNILRSIIDNNNAQILNANMLLATLKQDLNLTQKYASKQKKYKVSFAILSALLGVLVIIK